MKPVLFAVAAVSILAGCHAPSALVSEPHHGRFQGVGVYSTGAMWSRMKAATPVDKNAASLADDEHVIVVVDSQTGEVRQCGDLSGYCVRTNPWTGNRPALPAAVTIHAPELAATDMETTSNDATVRETAH